MSKEQAMQIIGGMFMTLFKQGQMQVTPEVYHTLQEAWNVIELCLSTETQENTPNANGSTSISSSVK